VITTFPIVVLEHNVIWCRIFNDGSIHLRARKANAYWKKIRTLFGDLHSFLETYTHPDVRRWSGYEIDDHAPRLALGPRD
jgi:hypothetical protein